ncbi:MAG: hypothetical protein V8R01_06380 [Bacilli bacterium]
MKFKKFSKAWFENKLKQYKTMSNAYPCKLTVTKGFKRDLSKQSKREQRINSLYELAKEKGIKLNG